MRLITVAIHTYEKALAVRAMLEAEGISVTLQNVNLERPEVSSGVRIRIDEKDLPLAIRIIENPDIFSGTHQSPASPSDHNILVPTDFKEYCYNAAIVATRLAAVHKVGLKFMHSYIDPHVTGKVQLSDNLTYELADSDSVEQLVKTSNIMMSDFTKRITDRMKNGDLPMVRFSHSIMEGVPEDAILEACKMEPPYLVVMGTRQAATKEKEMIGSVTAEVLDSCRFTVLSIPENVDVETYTEPKNILFFSNLNQEDILAMDTLYRLFPESQSKVTIVHIPSRNSFADRAAGRSALALSEYCERSFANYSFETVPISPKTAITELARLQRHEKFDLIVIPNRRKNAFSRLFNPGLAHKILFQTDIPMLMIPV